MTAPANPIMPLDWLRIVVRSRPRVSVTALAIAAKITELAKGTGRNRGTCFASVRTLAQIGISESSVRRATAELQDHGLLIMQSRGGRSGNGQASEQRLGHCLNRPRMNG